MPDLKTLKIYVHDTPAFVKNVLPDLQDGQWSTGPVLHGGPTMLGETVSDDAFAAWQAALDSAGIGYEIPDPPPDAGGHEPEHGATSIGD